MRRSGRLLRVLMPALGDCADPDRAVANLGRWGDAVTNRVSAYGLLASHPVTARMLVTVFAASQFFADLLIQTPEYLEVLLNPAIRDRGRDLAAFQSDLQRRVAIAATPNARRDALRRFKPPEVLRIGARDLLGYATMPETAREISDFAQACVQMAVQICVEERRAQELPFAVIALGKLGGRELNYASDIDLMFVHGDGADARAAVQLGEAVRDTLAKATGAGFVFRVDLRLRPEGRFGPISRSLESCRAYYESWAEPWERQALLKARFVAGDAAWERRSWAWRRSSSTGIAWTRRSCRAFRATSGGWSRRSRGRGSPPSTSRRASAASATWSSPCSSSN